MAGQHATTTAAAQQTHTRFYTTKGTTTTRALCVSIVLVDPDEWIRQRILCGSDIRVCLLAHSESNVLKTREKTNINTVAGWK